MASKHGFHKLEEPTIQHPPQAHTLNTLHAFETIPLQIPLSQRPQSHTSISIPQSILDPSALQTYYITPTPAAESKIDLQTQVQDVLRLIQTNTSNLLFTRLSDTQPQAPLQQLPTQPRRKFTFLTDIEPKVLRKRIIVISLITISLFLLLYGIIHMAVDLSDDSHSHGEEKFPSDQFD